MNVIDIRNNLHFLDQSIKIYEKCFEDSWREDTQKIIERVKNGEYRLSAFKKNDDILGICIVDIKQVDNYFLTFLAVDKNSRNQGIAKTLLKEAIQFFHDKMECKYFFVEAEKTESKLYQKMGFEVLEFEYFVPEFKSEKSIKMDLLLIKKQSICHEKLCKIIESVFCDGYGVSIDDERLICQKQRILRGKL